MTKRDLNNLQGQRVGNEAIQESAENNDDVCKVKDKSAPGGGCY